MDDARDRLLGLDQVAADASLRLPDRDPQIHTRLQEGTVHTDGGLDDLPEIDGFHPRWSELCEFQEILEEVRDALSFSVDLGKFRQGFRVLRAPSEHVNRDSQARQGVPHLPRDDHRELSDGCEAFQFHNPRSKPFEFLWDGREPMARGSFPRWRGDRLLAWGMPTRHRRRTGQPAYATLLAPGEGGNTHGVGSTTPVSTRRPEDPDSAPRTCRVGPELPFPKGAHPPGCRGPMCPPRSCETTRRRPDSLTRGPRLLRNGDLRRPGSND